MKPQKNWVDRVSWVLINYDLPILEDEVLWKSPNIVSTISDYDSTLTSKNIKLS